MRVFLLQEVMTR
jgi:hypothetical protein